MDALTHLHPDDMVLFTTVTAAMRTVAAKYGLPLRSISPMPKPEQGIDRLGDCTCFGDIRLILRFKVKGKWAEPRREEDVWATAAHELAHLADIKDNRFTTKCEHGPAFIEFEQEMLQAMRNRRDEAADPKQKLLNKLVKMQEQAHGEAKLGNTQAADAFAAAINRMLLENELRPSDLDYARTASLDPVVEVRCDLAKYGIPRKSNRVAWQESLARIVANANLCTFLLRPGSNDIWFVGTRAHAEVAEYTFGVLVPAAHAMSIQARYEYGKERKNAGGKANEANGYREAWLAAFVTRIGERMQEARDAAVASVPNDAPAGSESTALIRLNGAMAKVRAYVDAKYTGRGKASSIYMRGGHGHSAGSNAGRAAANRMAIGRKGIGSGVRGQLGS